MKQKDLDLFLDSFYRQYPWIRLRALFYNSQVAQMKKEPAFPISKDCRMTFRDMDDSNGYKAPKWGDERC